MTYEDPFDNTSGRVRDLGKSSPTLQPATVLSTEYPNYVGVNLNGGEIPALCVGGQFPAVGDTVLILQIGTMTVCMGAMPKPSHGIVKQGASGGRVLVTADDGNDYSVNYSSLYTPAVNDNVKLDWDVIGGFVVSPMASTPTGDPNIIVPTGPAPIETNHGPKSQTFYPTDSGTENGGSWFTTAVYCSDSDIGAYFYGNQIPSTIPAGALVTSGQIYIEETANYYPGSLATLGTTGTGDKSGIPGVGNIINISAGSGWKPLSSAIIAALANGSAPALATAHGGYHIFSPKGGLSGAVTLNWST
jgi:hypothetical protein